MDMQIRLARPEDAEAIGAIYAPYCGNSTVSFEITPPTPDELRERMAASELQYPWIVCTGAAKVIAFAYAGPHHFRLAYRWSVSTSVYVAEHFQKKGIGRGIYQSLLELLRLQGFVNAVALIAVPHASSIGLHASMGFTRVGLLEHIGYKAGVWCDVELWQKRLADLEGVPHEPLKIDAAKGLSAWEAAIAAGLGHIRI